jgi:hypothetical protein
MRWRCRAGWLAPTILVLALAVVTSCRDSQEPLGPDLGKNKITPTCQLGCTDPDPEPTVPGYFLGSGVTSTTCMNGSQTDADQDGLSDFCEKNLAAAFAPQLFYYKYDEVGREPHWVAKALSSTVVRIGYLLSYYRDAGNNSFGCSLPGAPSSCNGHNGDSEGIYLDVIYHGASGHWMLRTAWYSAHENMRKYDAVNGNFISNDVGYVYVEYPVTYRGFPRAYVSQGKHANYANRYECDNGGVGGADICSSVNTAARVVSGASLNLGSRAAHSAAQDCMQSANPSFTYYGSGKIECYWTRKDFRGWIPFTVGGASSSPYSDQLVSMGF